MRVFVGSGCGGKSKVTSRSHPKSCDLDEECELERIRVESAPLKNPPNTLLEDCDPSWDEQVERFRHEPPPPLKWAKFLPDENDPSGFNPESEV